jgi:hypothetical protein
MVQGKRKKKRVPIISHSPTNFLEDIWKRFKWPMAEILVFSFLHLPAAFSCLFWRKPREYYLRCSIRESIHVTTLGALILSSCPLFLLVSATLDIILHRSGDIPTSWHLWLGVDCERTIYFCFLHERVRCCALGLTLERNRRHGDGDGDGNGNERIRSSCNNNMDTYIPFTNICIGIFTPTYQLRARHNFLGVCIMMIEDL